MKACEAAWQLVLEFLTRGAGCIAITATPWPASSAPHQHLISTPLYSRRMRLRTQKARWRTRTDATYVSLLYEHHGSTSTVNFPTEAQAEGA